MTADYTELSLETFLDRVAQRAPIPGGGAVAATVGALACALARMVAAYSVTKKLPESDRARVDELSNHLRIVDELQRALITRDAEAYLALSDATAKRNATAASDSGGREGPARASSGADVENALQSAVNEAIGVPLQIVGLSTRTLTILQDLLPLSNRHLRSDLAIAATLSCAAADSAAYLVRANTQTMTDPGQRQRILADLDAMLVRCREKAASVRDAIDRDSA